MYYLKKNISIPNMVIYIASHEESKRAYVGRTSDYDKRKYQHLKSKCKDDFHNDLKIKDFNWRVLESSLNDYESKNKEIEYINYYKSIYNLYNKTIGGNGSFERGIKTNFYYKGKIVKTVIEHKTGELKKIVLYE